MPQRNHGYDEILEKCSYTGSAGLIYGGNRCRFPDLCRAHKAVCSELFDEIEGIAEGPGCSADETLFHQGSFEMDVDGPEAEQFRTLISIISLPAEGKIWVSPQPCEAPYKMFSL